MFLHSLFVIVGLAKASSSFPLTFPFPFPFHDKNIFTGETVQPLPFTSVAMCNDGSFQIAVTSDQTFYWSSGFGWIAETGIGLLGQKAVGISNNDNTGFEFTIAGTDGWKFYTGSSSSGGTWTLGTPSYNPASVNSLSLSGTVGNVNQILGVEDGEVWISSSSSSTFSKFVRTGDGAGSDFNEIATVASGSVPATSYVMAAYSSIGSEFYKTDNTISYFSATPITTFPTGWGSYSAEITGFTISSSGSTWMVSSSKGFSISTDTAATWSTSINATGDGVQGFAASPDALNIVTLSSNLITATWDGGTQWYDITPDWTPLPYQPLKASISNDGTQITIVTALNIYSGTSCAIAGDSINASCSWTSVSIQTSTSTFYKLSKDGLLGIKKSGDVSHLTKDGGSTWEVRLSTKDIDSILLEANMYFE